MPPPREPVQLALSVSARIAVALGGLLLLGILAVLVAVLVSLEGTRSEIRTTRVGVSQTEQRVERLTDGLQPVLDVAAPLADDSSRRGLRRAGENVSDAAGEVPALAQDARRALGAATFIAQILQGSDLGRSLTAVRSLADAAEPAARQLVPTITSLLVELDRGGALSQAACDRSLATRPPSAPGQIGCLLRTVPSVRGLLRSLLEVTRTSLTTQRSTLSFNRRIHSLFVESIAIQREILERTRSLDRKTGGSAPPTALTP